MPRHFPRVTFIMALHQASGRWQLGLALSVSTALLWATLPLALKLSLEQLDPITLTWFRFLVAAVLTALWLALRGQLGGYRELTGRHRAMLAVAALTLVGNYVFYLLGVRYTSPANAQLLIQLAPLLMAVGAIRVFGERFGPAQWAGLALLATGLLVFFGDQRRHATVGGYDLGSALVVLAAVVWAAYALLQKQLLMRLNAMQILLAIYVAAALVLLPFAHPLSVLRLDPLHAWLLAFCALNTVAAYGAFAEALAHWEASRVSAILATTPLLCIAAVTAAHTLWPALIAAERISIMGYIGAACVVLGSAAVSLLGARRKRQYE
jgi:drug/metabolite transporter (DMT)-like permease